MKGLRNTLGCTGQCGKCGKHVKKLRDQTLAEMQMLDHGAVIPVFAAI
jgi:bacterioferritin-associated ferredoxin